MSLLKKRDQWKVEPKDSVEVQKDSQADLLQKKNSKLTSARNSVELMRESKQKLKDLIPCPPKVCRSDRDKSDKRSLTSWPPKEPYCAHCGLRTVSSMDSALSRSCRSPKDSTYSRKESNSLDQRDEQGSTVVKLSAGKVSHHYPGQIFFIFSTDTYPVKYVLRTATVTAIKFASVDTLRTLFEPRCRFSLRT
nr:unnamed protein product [Callosobruchus chinensis]